MLNSAEFLYVDRRVFRVGKEVGCVVPFDAPSVTEVSGAFHQTERTLQCCRIHVIPAKAGIQKSLNYSPDGRAGCRRARARRPDFCKAMSEWAKRRVRRAFRRTVNEVSGALRQTERTLQCGRIRVIPAKAGIVRLKAHLVREVEVLFRYALSGL